MILARQAGEDQALDGRDIALLYAGVCGREQTLGDVWSAGKSKLEDDASTSPLQYLVLDLERDQRAR
ncbi:MAG: hypothetical protein DME00_36070 [Candidatus Rokuibacteriota bacterium]|nr:MAG: hypothetical protein DME00_36070 [Candidatus Rokubacteria bacterium]